MRINGFEQIKALYSIVFESKYDFKPQHISLYVFLINQNNRNNWVEWFKCPYDLAMAGSCIGNKKTYYNCLSDLQEWGLLKYEKGSNEWKSPKIRLEVLKCTSTDTATVPSSEPVLQPQHIPQVQPQDTHSIKHITNNLQPTTNKGQNEILPTLEERKSIFKDKLKNFKDQYSIQMLKEFYEYWTESNIGGTKMRFEKEKTYDIKLRLKNWKRNENKFNTNDKSTSIIERNNEVAERFISRLNGNSDL